MIEKKKEKINFVQWQIQMEHNIDFSKLMLKLILFSILFENINKKIY